MIGVGQPVRAVGDEGPGADLRDPARQRVDIAGDAVGLVDLGGEPCVRYAAPLHQECIKRSHQLGMGGGREAPVIRDLAGLPQPFHGIRAVGHVPHLAVARGVIEHALILGDRRAGQGLVPRRQGERDLQRSRARKNPALNCATAAF